MFRWLLYNLYPTSNNSPPSPFLFSQREKSLNFYQKSLRWWNSISHWLWVHWPKSLTKKVDDFPHLRNKIHQSQWISVNDFDLGGSFETGSWILENIAFDNKINLDFWTTSEEKQLERKIAAYIEFLRLHIIFCK